MKNRLHIVQWVVASSVVFAMGRWAPAATLYWDTNGATSGIGGTGTWDTGTTANWSTDPTGSSATGLWNQAGGQDIASFGGTAGTVTVSGTVNSNQLVFTVAGYTLSGGTVNTNNISASSLGLTINNTINLTGSNPTITSGAITIGGIITGSDAADGVTFTGSPNFQNTSTYAGNTFLTGANTTLHVIGDANGLPVTTIVNFNATGIGVDQRATAQTVAGLASTTSNVGNWSLDSNPNQALTLARNDGTSSSYGGTLTFDGTGLFANAGSLIKDGNYTQVLAGITTSASYGNFVNAAATTPTPAFTVKHGVLQLNKTPGLDAISVGAIAVTGGSLQLLASNQINDAAVMNVSATGKFDLNGSSETITSLNGNGTVTTGVAGTSTLTIGSTSNNVGSTFSGVIQNTAGNLGLTKIGAGTLTLTGANTYTGATTINSGAAAASAGTLTLNGNGGSMGVSALTFAGGGTFNYQGAAAGSSQSLGALSFNGGSGAVQSTYGTSGNTGLTFSSLGTRAAGATGNFVVSGGSNGTTNKIAITGQATGFINQGEFFGGSNYAYYDSGGFVRGINYGTDANSITSSGTTSITGSPTNLYVQTTGAVTAEATNTFTTLNISGNNNFTLTGGATLTVNGILKSGNTAGGATISGGTGIQAGSGAELVVRTDGVNDALTVSSPILNNGGNALTKSGAGTLTLGGSNTYTGATVINTGTLIAAANNALGTTAAGTTIDSGATLGFQGSTTYSTTEAVTINGSGDAGNSRAGAIDNISGNNTFAGGITLGSASTIGSTSGSLILSGTITGGGQALTLGGAGSGTISSPIIGSSTTLTKTGSGNWSLTNSSNTYNGATFVKVGTLTLSGAGKVAASPVTVSGGTLTLDNSTTSTPSRLGGQVLTLQNGTFNFIGNSGAASTESAGALTLDIGQSLIAESGVAASFATKATFSGLTRNNAAAALVTGSNFGGATTNANQLVFTTAPSGASGNLIGGGGTIGGTNKNVSIIPFMVGDATAGGTGTTFVGYDSTNGVRALSLANEFQTTIAAAGANDNVLLSGSGTSVSVAAATINSLILDEANATGPVTYTLGGTLTPNSGALLFSRSAGSAQSATVTGGTLTFAAANATTTSKEGVISVTNGANVAINSQITGSGGLTLNTFNSGSAITLGSTSNSYTGTTTINGNVTLGASNVIPDASPVYVALGGTLSLTGVSGQTETVASLAGAGTVDLGAATTGATLIVNGGNTTFTGTIKESAATGGKLTKAGTNTLVLSGTNSYTGATTVTGGTLLINDLETSGTASSIGAAGNAAGNIVLNGGTLEYFGNGGTGQGVTTDHLLSVGTTAGSALDSSGLVPVSFTNTGAIGFNSQTGARTFTLTGNNNGVNLFAPLIGDNTGATALTKSGTGTWLLTGLNTYTGVTTISGTLQVNNIDSTMTNAQALGKATTAIALGINSATTSATGTLEYTGAAAATLNRPITIGSVTSPITSTTGTIRDTGGALTLGGQLTTNGQVLTLQGGTINVSGKITGAASSSDPNQNFDIDGANSTLSNATNNYLGPTFVYNAGVLKNGVLNALPTTTTLTLGDAANTSGTYDLNGFNQTLTGLTDAGTGSRIVTNGGASGTNTLTITGAGTFSGVIQDGGAATTALTKSTSGTFTLGGANTYTGLTTVSGGTLAEGVNNAIASGAVTASGGTFDINGKTDTVGVFTFSGNGTFAGTGGGTLTASSVSVSGTGNTLSSGTIAGNATQAASSAWAVNGSLTGTDAMGGSASLSGTGSISGVVSLTGNNNSLSSSGTLATGGLNVSGTGNTITSGTVSGGATINGGGVLSVNGSLTGTSLVSGILQGSGSTGAVTVQNGGTLKGTLTAGATTVQSGGHLAPGNSPGIDTEASLALNNGSNYDVDLANTALTAGTDYDQTVVTTGPVTIGSTAGGTVNLNLSYTTYTHTPGRQIEIINNQSAGAVDFGGASSGYFKNGAATLTEGAQFIDSGNIFKISYQGGTGNDVVLSAMRTGTIALTGVPASVSYITGGSASFTASVANTAANDGFSATFGYSASASGTGVSGSASGSAAAGGAPAGFSVGASDATVGTHTGEGTVTVTGDAYAGNSPVSASFDVDVYDHSNGSWSNSSDVNAFGTYNFGTVTIGTSQTTTITLYNLASLLGLTADLQLAGGDIAGSGDAAKFTGITAFSGLTGGGPGESFLITFDTSAVGTFSGSYTLGVGDQTDLMGHTLNATPLTIEFTGTVVAAPEPASVAILAAGGLMLLGRRRPARDRRPGARAAGWWAKVH